MADPFSIATGAVQLAGAGIQLAKTLYEYLDCVKGAHKQVKAIAIEVRLTSSVLEHLGALLKENDAEKLCSESIVSDAQTAFNGCEDAFLEINDEFKLLIKPREEGKRNVSVSAKWIWPFKKVKLETLQANLERLKTTLLLMLSVLSYARDKSSRYAPDPAFHSQELIMGRPAGPDMEFTIKKLHIQNLMKARDDATERYERLILDFSQLGTTHCETDTLSDGADSTWQSTQRHAHSVERGLEAHATNPFYTTPASGHTSDDNGQDWLLLQLQICASAVSHLSATINAASFRWKTTQQFQRNGIAESFKGLESAVQRLWSSSNVSNTEINPLGRRLTACCNYDVSSRSGSWKSAHTPQREMLESKPPDRVSQSLLEPMPNFLYPPQQAQHEDLQHDTSQRCNNGAGSIQRTSPRSGAAPNFDFASMLGQQTNEIKSQECGEQAIPSTTDCDKLLMHDRMNMSQMHGESPQTAVDLRDQANGAQMQQLLATQHDKQRHKRLEQQHQLEQNQAMSSTLR